jgi:hypothetical protein
MSSNKIRVSLILGVISMTGITIIMLVLKLNEPSPIVQLPELKQLIQIPESTKVPDLINEFNQINSEISSFSATDVYVKIWENSIRFKISGSMYYEKTNNFRMKVWSIMGQEMDIGSNNDIFWYWSRRDRNPGVYYATYNDYQKTRLKTPFNPVFMRESLGIDQIDVTNAKISENEKYVTITWKKTNASNQEVLYSMFLSKSNKRMDGIIISDLVGKILVSCKIEYQGILPQRIVYDWQEEKKYLVVEFLNPLINRTHWLSDNWEMPRYLPKIDMGKE